ncbi:transcription factor GTE8-like [Chlorella sorokiniana]|uniref:Transcription factor GTE8-like n=1 Tax=Chlorella sorokiniana TaxID=3076 RepID=A0A2P6TSV8_CHLSO|nr:transcription factor GTE8-like [Chlorella sorokiniana]|eukprot:PRW57142.1 transcription factor GTE8-like [Chlorella sorokiniana]
MAFRKTGPKFLASTRAVLYKLTPSNVGQGEHAGEASRIRITHPVYWQMLDSMPHIAGQLQPGAQDEPRFIRLTHGRDTWEVPLKWIKKDGYQLEPDICALVLQGIGAYQANTFIVLELDTEQCSRQRLVGTIRRVDGSFPVASLPGRLLNPAAAAGRGEGLEFEHPVCAERLSASMPGGQLEEEDPSEQISWLGCMQPRSKRQKTHSRMAWEGVRSVLASLLHLPNVERVFGGPVDTVLYSDYLQVVQQPMDLGTIQKRLSDGAYDSPLQFCDDVRLVWSNCLRYNPPGNPVRDLGDTAAQQFDELWEQEVVADSGCLLGQLRKESKQEHQGQWMVKDVGAAGEQAQQTQQAQQAQPQEAACAQGQKRQRYEEAEEDEEQQQQQRWRQQPLQQQQQGGKRAKPGAAATTQQHVGLAPLLHGGSTNVVGAPLWLSQPGVLHSAALRPQPWPMGHLPPGYVPFNPTPDMLRAAADDEPLSWRRALHKLLKSGKGGATVEGILEQWERLPHKAQQAVYEEAVMAVQQEDWGQLEARLQQELDAAIEDAQTAGSG